MRFRWCCSHYPRAIPSPHATTREGFSSCGKLHVFCVDGDERSTSFHFQLIDYESSSGEKRFALEAVRADRFATMGEADRAELARVAAYCNIVLVYSADGPSDAFFRVLGFEEFYRGANGDVQYCDPPSAARVKARRLALTLMGPRSGVPRDVARLIVQTLTGV